MNYVIIGNSTAAIGCVEGIRSTDRESPITIIASEPHHTYSRPLISYLLGGKTDRERMKYRPDNFYAKNNCKTIFGTSVTAINPAKKLIVLSDGQTIAYDKLLVAAGSSPLVPPMNGLEAVENKFTFLSLDDALALEKAITKDSRVLVIGAGLIGLKCAEGILDSVKELTVVDLADQILGSILDKESAALMQAHLEETGLQFYLGDSVDQFEGKTAKLNSGAEVPFDVVVVAVGVRPNTGLISDCGGEVNRGILIDEACATSLPDIYAAGDCAEGYDSSVGETRVLALLPNAYMQGHCAGENMAGAQKSYLDSIPMNAIGLFGYHILTAGSYTGESKTIQDGKQYKRMFWQDGLLKGYILLGNIDRAGIYTSLIREKTPLEEIDFDRILEAPQLMAFSPQARRQKLSRPDR